MEFHKVRLKNNRNLLEYQYVDHHIEILSHDRDNSNVDVHKQAMLSTKSDHEERPTEKQADSKKENKCFYLNDKTGYKLI